MCPSIKATASEGLCALMKAVLGEGWQRQRRRGRLCQRRMRRKGVCGLAMMLPAGCVCVLASKR
jgi:hypothetical protein